ncbi:MAG: hypothetical protein IKU07_08375 [Oscillospiraceae bacterium]|nr:hypothetical protein [Oscillospiraceae bacterium]
MIKVGFGRRDITPEWSVPLAGYGNTDKRMSQNVLDPLTTSCVAFTDAEDNILLLISSDLIKSSINLTKELQKEIRITYGIPESHVMVCNTHTHCGPDLLNAENEAIIHYRPFFVHQAVVAVAEALMDRKPAEMFVGRKNLDGLNWCRHYIRNDEDTAFIGHIRAPDPQVQLVKIKRENAKDIILMNWQAHPCYYDGSGKYDISADYIHAVRNLMEEKTEAALVFFQGAAGDLTARSKVKDLRLAGDTYDYAKKMVPELLSILDDMKPITDGLIAAAEKTVQLTVDHSDDALLDDAKKVIDHFRVHYDGQAAKALGAPLGIHSYYHACAISRRAALGVYQDMTIYAASVGELGFAFAPYEMFSSNGAFVKANSPFEATFMVGYSNGGYTYIADDQAFDYGCYEVDSRNFVRGTAEQLADSFVSLLEELRCETPINPVSLDTITASLCYAMGVEPPAQAAKPCEKLVRYIDEKLPECRVDRVLMYNPDAISQWVYRKLPFYLQEAVDNTELEVPLCTVYPSVTPVCFGTMYTGAQPEVHGIQEYSKPVIKIDTIFDALIRAGKKPLIIASSNCSLSKIYLERDMDYIFVTTVDQVNAEAAKAIMEDKYDFIVVYNGNYDAKAHRWGPEDPKTLAELKCNSRTFAMLSDMVKTHWKRHNTLVGFAMDHGNHWVEPFITKGGKLTYGSHGEYVPEDMNIVHRYRIYPASE